MAAKNGGPAFPVSYSSDGNPGMTLRDYFAGQALAGWLAGIAGADWMREYDGEDLAFVEHQRAVAETCYAYADAMLAAREEVA